MNALPKYTCIKQVSALKIDHIQLRVEEGASKISLIPELANLYGPIEVTHEWYERHRPENGGYYVVYEDGNASYSPAAAFEKGYTLAEVEAPDA